MFDDLGLAHLGDAGVAVAVLATVIIVIWAVQRVSIAWLETIRERNRQDHELEEKRQNDKHAQELAESAANQAIADALRELKNQMESDQARQDLLEATTRSLIASAKQLAGLIESTTDRMKERTQETDQKLAALHADVRTVPAEVWRLGDPKFGDVLTALTQMESRLLQKIQPGADVARSIIREEFGDLITRVRVIVEYLERDQADGDQRAGQDARPAAQNGDPTVIGVTGPIDGKTAQNGDQADSSGQNQRAGSGDPAGAPDGDQAGDQDNASAPGGEPSGL